MPCRVVPCLGWPGLPARRVFLGLVAVTVGVAVFLDRVGGVEGILPTLRTWWPLVLIAFGAANLVRFAPRPWGVLGPLLVIAGGAVLLLITLDRLEWDDFPLIWPAALVVAGFVVALAGADWPDRRTPHQNELRQFVWLRGKRVESYASQFWRADVTVVLGSFELDLREAHFARQAMINVNALFGTVDVVVPEGVTVRQRRPFLLDRFGLHAKVPPPTPTARLVISALALFGRVTTRQATIRPAGGTEVTTSAHPADVRTAQPPGEPRHRPSFRRTSTGSD